MLLKLGQINSKEVKVLRIAQIHDGLSRKPSPIMLNISLLLELEPNRFLEILTSGQSSAMRKMALWMKSDMCISAHCRVIHGDGSLSEPLKAYSELDMAAEIKNES